MLNLPPDTSLPFGTLDGRTARIYTLESEQLRVRITDYGGILVSVEAPDRDGRRDHVLLGFDDLDTYVQAGGSFGAVIGRYANRIAGGRFEIDGTMYETSRNDHGSTLHGGKTGFGECFWTVEAAAQDQLTLSLVSADGDQGFPGTLTVTASYHLSGCELRLDIVAQTTKATPLSLGTHPYFNLGGLSATDCLAHQVTIAATEFLATDERQIPTGERRPVAGTAFDFTTPRVIGDHIRNLDAQLQYGCGYDHYFVLSDTSPSLRPAVRMAHPPSGRILEVLTTQPGVQFYSGNQLNGTARGRNGLYRQSAGVAVETTAFPNAVNQPDFPNAVLRPDQTYRHSTRYRFLTDAPEKSKA